MKPQPAHPLIAERFFSPGIPGWACFLLLLVAGPLLRASDLPSPYTLDFPFQANQATPVWLGHPETTQDTFATLDLPITPPNPSASLLVTVLFQEKEGGFLRIIWQGPNTAQMLSNNFYEGIGMNNQRALLIDPETMQEGGTLRFQCGDTTLGIKRIKLEWLDSRTGLVSPLIQDLLVTPASGVTQPAQILDGDPKQADQATWHNQIVNVPITELPERIERGVEYSVQVDQAPGSARLVLKEAGLPWGQHLIVWINQKRAGTINPTVPDLLDDGFLSQGNTPDNYIGWREGSFYVPVSLLSVGVNTVQLSPEDDAAPASESSGNAPTGATLPLAVKDMVLQVNFPPSPAPQADPPPPRPPGTAQPLVDSSLPSPIFSPPTLSPPETITP